MFYEKFIIDFLNIKPSDLSKISTSSRSDGSVFVRVKLALNHFTYLVYDCTIKLNCYYDKKIYSFSILKSNLSYDSRAYRYLREISITTFIRLNLFDIKG